MSSEPQSFPLKPDAQGGEQPRAPKCAHEPCRCVVEEGEDPFCSEVCAKGNQNVGAQRHKLKYCTCAHDVCLRECDLIMKGGITSGIVYPPLVIRLSRTFRFRNIGGTSAGAIAAAITAAAELGRHQTDAQGRAGFDKLAAVKDWLGDTESKNLRNLFQPSARTRPLMDALLALATRLGSSDDDAAAQGAAGPTAASDQKNSFSRFVRFLPEFRTILWTSDQRTFVRGTARWLRLGLAAGALVALLFSSLSYSALALAAIPELSYTALNRALLPGWVAWPAWYVWAAFFMLFLLLFSTLFGFIGHRLGGVVYSMIHLYRIATDGLRSNGFGLCNGLSQDPLVRTTPPLTVWLGERINDLAGLEPGGPPLTFGQLWGPGDPDKRQIDLRMVTSNLSQSQPYILPFGENYFLFKLSDFAELFPPAVVNHMSDYAPREKAGYGAPEGFCFLPDPQNFPVIVATRMSLSFPVLLSAVPLYTIKHNELLAEAAAHAAASEGPEGEGFVVQLHKNNLQKNWFSDGGICSNFPIHFFDAWLPRRPTFGVNLTSLPKTEIQTEIREDGTIEDVAVYEQTRSVCPRQNPRPDKPEYGATDVIDKAVYLPSVVEEPSPLWVEIPSLGRFFGEIFRTAQNYRDNMQACLPSYRERIVQVALSDKEGGLNLEMPPKVIKEVVHKGNLAGEKLLHYFDFEQHQWVRFRVLMGQMEESLRQMYEVMNTGEPFPTQYLLEKQETTTGYPYRFDADWAARASARLEDMKKLIEGWGNERLFEREPPLPKPKLRVTPEI